jgi:hypothetical protein
MRLHDLDFEYRRAFKKYIREIIKARRLNAKVIQNGNIHPDVFLYLHKRISYEGTTQCRKTHQEILQNLYQRIGA